MTSESLETAMKRIHRLKGTQSPEYTCRAPWHPEGVSRKFRAKKSQASCPRCKTVKALAWKDIKLDE